MQFAQLTVTEKVDLQTLLEGYVIAKQKANLAAQAVAEKIKSSPLDVEEWYELSFDGNEISLDHVKGLLELVG